MDRKFLMFYKKGEGCLGHVWIYGKEELKKEVKANEMYDGSDIEILQVIEIFDYKEIDIDDILEEE